MLDKSMSWLEVESVNHELASKIQGSVAQPKSSTHAKFLDCITVVAARLEKVE